MRIFEKLSQNTVARPSHLPLCSKIRKNKGFLTSAAQWIINPNPTQQPTPLGTSTPTSVPSRSATTMFGPGNRSSSSSPTSPKIVPINPYANVLSNSHHNKRLWTFHRERKTLELGQICSNNSGNGFSRQLRETHRDLRGFYRVWFSFWRFSHCGFVKVSFFRSLILPFSQLIPFSSKKLGPITSSPDVVIYQPPSTTSTPRDPHMQICPLLLLTNST